MIVHTKPATNIRTIIKTYTENIVACKEKYKIEADAKREVKIKIKVRPTR